jgi:hypothetical protein
VRPRLGSPHEKRELPGRIMPRAALHLRAAEGSSPADR